MQTVVAKVYKSLLPHQASVRFTMAPAKACLSQKPVAAWDLEESLQTGVIKTLTGCSSGTPSCTNSTAPDHRSAASGQPHSWMCLSRRKLAGTNLLTAAPGEVSTAAFVELEVKHDAGNKGLLLIVHAAGGQHKQTCYWHACAGNLAQQQTAWQLRTACSMLAAASSWAHGQHAGKGQHQFWLCCPFGRSVPGDVCAAELNCAMGCGPHVYLLQAVSSSGYSPPARLCSRTPSHSNPRSHSMTQTQTFCQTPPSLQQQRGSWKAGQSSCCPMRGKRCISIDGTCLAQPLLQFSLSSLYSTH